MPPSTSGARDPDGTDVPRIVLSRSAVAKLLADPMLRLWQHGDLGRKRPVLWYYRWTAPIRHGDGIVPEHGDGFMLTFCEPEELEQFTVLDSATVAVADGLDILVVAGERRLSGSLLIGLRKGKYTCEPLDT